MFSSSDDAEGGPPIECNVRFVFQSTSSLLHSVIQKRLRGRISVIVARAWMFTSQCSHRPVASGRSTSPLATLSKGGRRVAFLVDRSIRFSRSTLPSQMEKLILFNI